MTDEATETPQRQIAVLLADALGDILKRGSDYEDAIASIEEALTIGDEIKSNLIGLLRGVNIMEATAEADRPTEAVSQLRDISSWLDAEGEGELMVNADDLADSIASAYKVGP